jgi:hypothetical protein
MGNIKGDGYQTLPDSIQVGNPLIMKRKPACDFLVANYAGATSIHKGRPPAMGEICALHQYLEEDKLVIPMNNLRGLQRLFSTLRNAEGKFGRRNGSSLYHMMSQENRPPEAEEQARMFSECYNGGRANAHW